MYVIRVVPLAALPITVPQVLDYFWADPLPQGSLVTAMIGRRSVTALVVDSLDLVQAKMLIKKSSFGLKKISSIITTAPQATAGQIALAQWISNQYYAPFGLCLKTVLPGWIGKRGNILELVSESKKNTAKEKKIQLIQTQPDTAITEIRKHISGAKGQIFILVPERALAEYLGHVLKDTNPAVIQSDLTTKQHATIYRSVLSGDTRVIIGTRVGLFLPWKNLTDVVVEDALHEAYKSDMTPRYASSDVARHLAQMHGASLTYLTPALSVSNQYLIDKDLFIFKHQKPYWPQIIMADMTAEQQRDNHSVLSRHAQDTILDALEATQRILIFSPRRAYSSTLRCQRCHKAVLCATCEIPMRLHRTTEDMLICYHCTAYTTVPKQCPSCKAGPLKPGGIAGSQKIAQAINECLDRHGHRKISIPILDSDLVKSEGDKKEIFDQYHKATPGILVATQMIFSHRYVEQFDHIVVIGADALSYNPDFRTQERLIYQLEKLADFKPATMTIQYWDENSVLAQAPNRSWESFYTDELKDRKTFNWPPFARIAKLTMSHRDRGTSSRQAAIAVDRLQRAAAHMGAAKAVNILGPTPALVEKAGGKWTQHVILKTSLAADKMRELLAHLPAGWTIDIDPRSIT